MSTDRELCGLAAVVAGGKRCAGFISWRQRGGIFLKTYVRVWTCLDLSGLSDLCTLWTVWVEKKKEKEGKDQHGGVALYSISTQGRRQVAKVIATRPLRYMETRMARE